MEYTTLLLSREENSKATNTEQSRVLPIFGTVVVDKTAEPVLSAPIEPNASTHGSQHNETQGLKT